MRKIYIDPAYTAYYKDRMFDDADPVLNRDDTLAPNIRLRLAINKRGSQLQTADYLLKQHNINEKVEYYSFGVIKNYKELSKESNIKMCGFAIFEPPVVAPQLYYELPNLTKVFERVFLHNVEGDGYSLNGVDVSKLHKFYWPQSRAEVIESCWKMQNRQHRIVVINGNHKPVSYRSELYSKRIEYMAILAKLGVVDLYGRGWGRWWSRNSMWFPYWRNYNMLMSIYKGECVSKYDVLKNYSFALCFENMEMKGYVTEKIFDCFYAGTIPIYWGATDITDLIPREAYVNARNYETIKQMCTELMHMSAGDIRSMREAGREFLKSELGMRYYNGLNKMIIQ